MAAGLDIGHFLYTYDFGDGSSGTGSRTQHTFARIGTYDYTLTIRDARPAAAGAGLRAQALAGAVVYSESSWQTIWRRAPQARFAIQGKVDPVYVARPGAAPTFDASASVDPNTTPSPLEYAWDFGDGTTGSGVSAQHAYAAMGRYVVTLTVTNAFGLSDKYRDIVHVRDPKANFRLNVEQATPVTSASVPANEAPGTLRAQSATSNTLEYFPYVLPASNRIKSGSFKSLNEDGTPASTFCNQLSVNQNGADVFITKTENASLGTDANGNAIYCTGLLYTANRPMLDKTISSLFATSSRYLDEVQFSVFSRLAVPRVLIGIFPDEYISGEVASPSVKEFRTVNPSTGKTEWLMQVNIRQSEVKAGNIKLRVPVLALDAAGKYRSNATGRFKASFGDTSLQSDCGDCTMLGGRGYITITIPIAQFQAGSEQALNLGTVGLGTDNGCAQTDMFGSGNFRFTGCAALSTTSEYPTDIASGLNAHPYPPSATLLGHVYYGDSIKSVAALRIYGRIGHVAAHANVEYNAPYLLREEHKEQLEQATAALVADGKFTPVEWGQLSLAQLDYWASYLPQALRPPRFFALQTKSVKELGAVSKVFDDITNVSAVKNLETSRLSDLLTQKFGPTAKALESCPSNCLSGVEDSLDALMRAGKTPAQAAARYEQELAGVPNIFTKSINRLAVANARFAVCSIAELQALGGRPPKVEGVCGDKVALKNHIEIPTARLDNTISGGHTKARLESKGWTVNVKETAPNGVMDVDVLSANGTRLDGKTLFPRQWTSDQIDGAIAQVLATRKRTPARSTNSNFIKLTTQIQYRASLYGWSI